jgi:hypothetical protein
VRAVGERPHAAGDHLTVEAAVEVLRLGGVVLELADAVDEDLAALRRLPPGFGDEGRELVPLSPPGQFLAQAGEYRGDRAVSST